MDNPLALFSNKLCQGQTACERELERQRADLDAEKNRSQRGFARLSVELRLLREKAEREHQRDVKELAARRKCQANRDSQRCSHKASGGYRSESAEKDPFCLSSPETHAKLEQLLDTLNKKIDGGQPFHKLRHRQGFELEKAIFLCHLLKAYRILLREKRRAGRSGHGVRGFSRKLPDKDDISSCLTGPPQTCSGALLPGPHSASRSPKRQSKRNQPEWKAVHAADPCPPATALDTCRSSAVKSCRRPNVPHAGWTAQESPPPMEVGYLRFLNKCV